MSTLNSKTFNQVPWNWPGELAAQVSAPLAIDDRTIATATWEDIRTLSGATWEDIRTLSGATWEDTRTIALGGSAMTETGIKIENIAIGDDKRIKRTYTGLPTGTTIDKAWLTVRLFPSATVLSQLEITTASTASGQITDATTTTDGELAFYFDLPRSATATATATTYLYDIQIKRSTGEIHTLESGKIIFISQITEASS